MSPPLTVSVLRVSFQLRAFGEAKRGDRSVYIDVYMYICMYIYIYRERCIYTYIYDVPATDGFGSPCLLSAARLWRGQARRPQRPVGRALQPGPRLGRHRKDQRGRALLLLRNLARAHAAGALLFGKGSVVVVVVVVVGVPDQKRGAASSTACNWHAPSNANTPRL